MFVCSFRFLPLQEGVQANKGRVGNAGMLLVKNTYRGKGIECNKHQLTNEQSIAHVVFLVGSGGHPMKIGASFFTRVAPWPRLRQFEAAAWHKMDDLTLTGKNEIGLSSRTGRIQSNQRPKIDAPLIRHRCNSR